MVVCILESSSAPRFRAELLENSSGARRSGCGWARRSVLLASCCWRLDRKAAPSVGPFALFAAVALQTPLAYRPRFPDVEGRGQGRQSPPLPRRLARSPALPPSLPSPPAPPRPAPRARARGGSVTRSFVWRRAVEVGRARWSSRARSSLGDATADSRGVPTAAALVPRRFAVVLPSLASPGHRGQRPKWRTLCSRALLRSRQR